MISLGAGVQSSTMALMAAAGEITPMPTACVFADTGDEPDAVYEWLKYLEPLLPFELIRVQKGRLSDYLTTPYKSKKNNKWTVAGFPAFVLNQDGSQGIMSRQCTSDFKVYPIDRVLTRLMRTHKTKTCFKWLGISLDEIYRIKPARRNSVKHRWPLVEARMNRNDCLRWLEAHGHPKPPRSACIYCPYRGNDEWRALTPSEFTRAVEFEKKMQAAHAGGSLIAIPYLHRSMVPLDEVDFSTDIERGQGLLNGFQNECSGHCGL